MTNDNLTLRGTGRLLILLSLILPILITACGGGAASITTQLCNNFGTLSSNIEGIPEISADTDVAGLSGQLDNISPAVTAIVSIGKSIQGVERLETTFNQAKESVSLASDTTLGDRAEDVNGKIKSMKGAATGLIENYECEQ